MAGTQELSLELKEGQSLLIMGQSGCGKSSLLRAIAGTWLGPMPNSISGMQPAPE
jgi:ABC-type uncharacterized transport system fused permease/ATPase subunit